MKWLLFIIPTVFLLAYLIIPILYFLAEGWNADEVSWSEIISGTYYQKRIVWTFLQAILSTATVFAIGFPIGVLLACYHFLGKNIILNLLLLPFVVPPIIVAMGFLAMFGQHGILGINLEGTPYLILLANVFYNLAVMVRLVYSGVRKISPQILQSARTLGASFFRTVITVIFPLSFPTILAGISLVFLYTFTSFVLPLFLGGMEYTTVEWEIYSLAVHQLSFGHAGILAMIQLAITSFVLILVYFPLQKQYTLAGEFGQQELPSPSLPIKIFLFLLLFLVILFLFSPLLAVLLKSFTSPQGFTFQYYWNLFDSPIYTPLSLGLKNTLKFAILTVICSVGLGILQSLASYRYRFFEHLAILPLIISPSMISIGYLLSYPDWAGSQCLLIGAYTLVAYPLVTRTLVTSLRSIPHNLVEVARTLGSKPFRVVYTVIFPMILPSLRTAVAFAMAVVMGEFSATLVLSRPEWATLTIAMYERLSQPGRQNLGEAMALAVIVLFLTLTCLCLMDQGKIEIG